MEVIYVLIPLVLIFGFLVVIAFIWMAKKGFFEDLDGQAQRILMDDDLPARPQPEASRHESEPSPEKNTTN
ncbi:MAG: cbb3-type cytochrome oxidase assembly protein CcoS [Thiotrichales bacterium]|nr:cbb3-type cytochrome oxidase assembly protein CcoS [Thiotrichales bacterium]